MNPLTTLLSAAVLSSVIATGAFGQTADIGRALVASNVLKLSADTARSGGSPTTVKELFVPYGGVVRVKWQLRSNDTDTGMATITSATDSCNSQTTHLAFQQFTCDLHVASADIVKVQVSGQIHTMPTIGFSTAVVRNVRIYYNVVNSTGLGKVLLN
jgi:hypothetical protein